MPHTVRPTHGRYGRPWYDGKAPDGFTVNGWRRINKGGYIRFCGGKHYHEKFPDWVGMWVFVELADCWGCNVDVFPETPWNTQEKLYCTSELDWFAHDPKSAAIESRKTRSRCI